jgi:hypothetical protein
MKKFIIRLLGLDSEIPQIIEAESNSEITIQERYWNHLIQQKFDEIYVSRYLQRSEKWDTTINAFLAIVSASSVSAWALWKKYDLFWAGVIMLSQVITAGKPYLPFRKRINPLKAAGFAYEELFIKAESNWLRVASGELDESEINKLLFSLKSEQAKAWKKLAGDISLPDSPKLRRHADRLTAEYFRHNYNQPIIINP